MTLQALATAGTGMAAQQILLDQIANDLANANTTGYKRKMTVFATLASQDLRRTGSSSSMNGTVIPSGVNVGLGVKAAGIINIMEKGPLLPTENPLHLAIDGVGYFQIQLPDGRVAYTRAGEFETGPDGMIVTQDGYSLIPGITVETGQTVNINQNGEVYGKTKDTMVPVKLGQIELSKFANANGLEPMEGNLLLETPASGAPVITAPGTDGTGSIASGYLEGSNVNAILSITDLIKAQRAFEMNTKAAKTAEEMSREIKNLGA